VFIKQFINEGTYSEFIYHKGKNVFLAFNELVQAEQRLYHTA